MRQRGHGQVSGGADSGKDESAGDGGDHDERHAVRAEADRSGKLGPRSRDHDHEARRCGREVDVVHARVGAGDGRQAVRPRDDETTPVAAAEREPEQERARRNDGQEHRRGVPEPRQRGFERPPESEAVEGRVQCVDIRDRRRLEVRPLVHEAKLDELAEPALQADREQDDQHGGRRCTGERSDCADASPGDDDADEGGKSRKPADVLLRGEGEPDECSSEARPLGCHRCWTDEHGQ